MPIRLERQQVVRPGAHPCAPSVIPVPKPKRSRSCSTKKIFIAVSIVVFIILGSVLEGIPAIVLFGPLLFPIAAFVAAFLCAGTAARSNEILAIYMVTAFGIAGRGEANPRAMIAAIALAGQCALARTLEAAA